jgi:ribosomal protein L11 methyltransferase
MSNYCLRIGPVRREIAEACEWHLDNRAHPQALSLFEANETGSLWRVEAYFGSRDEAEQARAGVGSVFGPAACATSIEEVRDTDWVTRSLEGLRPVQAGRFFIHGSHDRALRPVGAVAIEIDAATAFGTGHHGSTRGCLHALDALLRTHAPERVLDVGSGSGILAIAAARALKRKVIASDIDVEAVRITAANAKLNEATVTAVTATGTNHRVIRECAPFDLIMANILARPLVQLAPALARITANRGRVILSGLLAEQAPWIASAYRVLGFRREKTFDDSGWVTLVMRRP